MGKNKLARFEENKSFGNLFQYVSLPSSPDFELKGQWKSKYFGNENPIVLELGCGKGDYTNGLAARNPNLNFIGVDIKGARLWRACKNALEKNLSNVAYVRIQIEFIEKIFAENEISDIWITFPDPQPNKERKRLSSERFLQYYSKIIKKDGIVRLKTDDEALYLYTLDEVVKPSGRKIIANTSDLYSEKNLDSQELREAAAIQTYYEGIWLSMNKSIKYLAFECNKI